MNPTRRAILLHLGEAPGATFSDLAAGLELSRGHVKNEMGGLSLAGYVTSVLYPAMHFLTAPGRAFVKQMGGRLKHDDTHVNSGQSCPM